MKKGLTELVFIMDCSGSMHGMEKDTIGGFNATVEEQRKKEGEVLVSAVLFDDDSRVVYDRVPMEKVEPMTEKTYYVGGCTALMDAMGGAMHHIGNVHKYARDEDRPEHTVFVIITDGYENASVRYSTEQVRQMVTRQKEKYGWEFLFLGANIDAVEAAGAFGIDASRASDYVCDSAGTGAVYRSVSRAVMYVRENACMPDCWNEEIKEDMKKRKQN